MVVSIDFNECLMDTKIIKLLEETEITIKHKNNKEKDYTIKLNDKFSKLIVVKFVIFEVGAKDKRTRRGCICKCDCGKFTGPIPLTSLISKHTTSCGCCKFKQGFKSHTENNHIIKHGDSRERLYSIWRHMVYRSTNPGEPNAKYYVNKLGHCVCEEWENDYFKFKEWALNNGYNDNLTLDRIDVNKGYSPDNCRWSDIVTQNNNKSNNRLITYNSETKTLSEWARDTGIRPETISDRLSRGWTVGQALNFEYKKKFERNKKK